MKNCGDWLRTGWLKVEIAQEEQSLEGATSHFDMLPEEHLQL